ncbi:MAG: D-ribose pyranase [Coriobacteriaceae bacterium]|nr:D-ribose pyranase [Coriobacteriaceae bacterium]
MKKRGIINAQLAGLIAGLGHKDIYMIADAGMPIPAEVEIVDLAVIGGVPTFQEVMDAVLDEAVVEHYTLAEEIKEANPKLLEYIQGKLPNTECDYVPHTELKQLEYDCKFVIRTGEFSPYPNILLRAAVAF